MRTKELLKTTLQQSGELAMEETANNPISQEELACMAASLVIPKI